jgi:transposase-like protein
MGAITAEVVDTGEKRDMSGRRVSNAERRREMVEAYRGSGLTMAAFARRERINYATFAGWVAKAAHGKVVKAPIKFAEVALPQVPRESATLEVRFSDGTVVRGNRVDEVAELVRLLRA